MLRPRDTLLPLLLLVTSLSAYSQAGRPPYQPGWTPQSLNALAQRATFHTNFTFNRDMLRFVNNYIDNGDAETRQAVAKLDSISVESFHFSAPGLYDQAALQRVRADYAATGWKHMTTARAKGDPFNGGQTDIWISFAHAQVTGMTVLLAGAKDIDLISIKGDISPLDLLHLRGHFGIPKFDADGIAADAGTPPPNAGAEQPGNVPPAPPPPTPPNQ
jgi:hypothetical protein